ncbi:MAG: sodium:solute symporter family protein [Planctomycetes bacterium]|nr:sodium:solute symporter family protein [Planctomycetota bacterium]MCB9890489.1 sodium:solute symporter family protein [Planctomycetota bacterium]MCB9917730.1 sodium:solute symporter family protein [Planctomycetota bacterium]
MTVGIILAYVALLLGITLYSTRRSKKDSGDYFLANRGIGSFMLLMSIFGTTMTAFALVGSTGRAFEKGIGVYGLMASWSGIIHSLCFFLIGAKVWRLGKEHGYVTQLAFFRDRYRSEAFVLLLFPMMVGFVLIYILVGVVGSGRVVEALTPETFARSDVTTSVVVDASLEPKLAAMQVPDDLRDKLSFDASSRTLTWTGSMHPKRRGALMKLVQPPSKPWADAVGELVKKAPRGSIPYAWGMGFVSLVVLIYVFFGGMRATAWANTMQTIVFMVMGVVAFIVIKNALGGAEAASKALLASKASERASRAGDQIGKLQFLTYCFVPLSVGMFPHLFQHWLTAKRASNFKLTVVAHPLFIAITWVPCILLGIWAAAVLPETTDPNAVLGTMVSRYAGDVLSGLIGAGILAAIMSSMDSQFLCLGSLFTNDIVDRYGHRIGLGTLDDRAKVRVGRIFVVAMVLIAFGIGLTNPGGVFPIGVWCFTGFASLFPIVFAALYWKRSNKHGVIAAALTVAVLWFWFLGDALTGEFLIGGMMPVTIVLAASAVVLVVVTLLTPPPPRDVQDKFFPERTA